MIRAFFFPEYPKICRMFAFRFLSFRARITSSTSRTIALTIKSMRFSFLLFFYYFFSAIFDFNFKKRNNLIIQRNFMICMVLMTICFHSKSHRTYFSSMSFYRKVTNDCDFNDYKTTMRPK